MIVEVETTRWTFDGRALELDPYWFRAAAESAGLTPGTVLRRVVTQWADAVAALEEDRAIFLPYSLDDEWTDCLRAERRGDDIHLETLEVGWNGYSVDLFDLEPFIVADWSRRTIGETTKPFGSFAVSEFVAGLRNVTVHVP